MIEIDALSSPEIPHTEAILSALNELTLHDSTLSHWLELTPRRDLEKLVCLLATTGEWKDPFQLSSRMKIVQRTWNFKPITIGTPVSVPDLIKAHSGDAEKAFLAVYPIGQSNSSNMAMDPGQLYLKLRQSEAPQFRKKEADLLKTQADQLLSNLEKWSLETLRVLQQQLPRMGDTELRFRRQRDLALQSAWDYPRALHSLKGTLVTLHQQKSLDGLRAIRFFLVKAEKEWSTYSRRLRDTPAHPLNSWCARIKEMQTLAETIRRGLAT